MKSRTEGREEEMDIAQAQVGAGHSSERRCEGEAAILRDRTKSEPAAQAACVFAARFWSATSRIMRTGGQKPDTPLGVG